MIDTTQPERQGTTRPCYRFEVHWFDAITNSAAVGGLKQLDFRRLSYHSCIGLPSSNVPALIVPAIEYVGERTHHG